MEASLLFRIGFLTAVVLMLTSSAKAVLGEAQYVVHQPSDGSFVLAANGLVAPICTDTNDYWGVLRAIEDLRMDVQRVTGATPNVISNPAQAVSGAIIVGTLGKNHLIDQWVKDGQLNCSRIARQWESFLVQVVGSNVVVVGSDKRGTIYGIYDLSQQMGVSPWYWWTDVPARHADNLYVLPGIHQQGPPTVKYRGIFLNDEAPDLTGWVNEKFGGYNHAFYTNIFELLLRLRANYLWPAMWDNCFSEDDPLNPKLADAYGIVMGTSHVEPMMRADKEWNRLGYTAAQWNYDKHPDLLERFWKDGLERNKAYENIITIGMRGKIDTPMSRTANIALLEKIVMAQRKIIGEVMRTNAESVPQLWCLYKEVQDYYDKGMRVPDDVTLLWSDDNWGDLRRVPTAQERNRAGGAGIYYHLDYVGGPRNYKWLNSTPITKVWQQMNTAWQYGANRIWIVNVGHLHHVTYPTEFFLTFAWSPAAWPRERTGAFGRLWAEREFGPKHASEIADIVAKYTKYNGRRKPELLNESTYSLTNYHEADRVVAEWEALVTRAERIKADLPNDAQDAFYELVYHPVKACATLNELYVAAAKSRMYAAQGDSIANQYADQAHKLFQEDAELSAYFNHTLAHGKWDHMMDQTHIGYTSWQQPPRNTMPPVGEIEMGTNSAPSPGQMSMDSGGYVSIEAEHYTAKHNTEAASWRKIDDYGRTLSAVAVFPPTAPSVPPPGETPWLEYGFDAPNPGQVTIEFVLAPTLNFLPGAGVRFALSLDDQPSKMIDALGRNSLREWETAVANNARKVRVREMLTASGHHRLRFAMVDPGVVLEKIVIDFGGEKPSYLGPPETPAR